MVKSYPLILEDMEFRIHEIIGIYSLSDKIAFIHAAFGFQMQEAQGNEIQRISYVLLDTFTADFSRHEQDYLSYLNQGSFEVSDAVCQIEKDSILLNTKKYTGYRPAIAKLIRICDTGLTEIGDAPTPVEEDYNYDKIYHVRDCDIHMASSFIMECHEHVSGNLRWKLRLSAYLYSNIEEKDGILYFGTAGKGGRFYGVRLLDGDVVCNYNTGGTVHFLWYKDYVLLADRKCKPVLIDPQNGAEVKRIEFGKFKITYDQDMFVKDGRLYAAARKDDRLYAVCAGIE